MAVRALADAFVRIRPDVSGFRAEVDAKLTAAMKGASQNVLITANTQAALLKMADLRTQLTEMGRKVTSARLIADSKQLQADLAKAQADIQAWAQKTNAKKVTLAGADKIEAQVMRLNLVVDKFMEEAVTKHVNMDTADAQTKLAALLVGAEVLSKKAYEARVGLTGDAAVKMAALITELEEVTNHAWEIRLGIHDDQITKAGAALERLTAEFERLTYKDVPAATAGTTRLWGIWGALGARVALFGGVASVTGWHIAIDGVIEALAVLVPAIVTVAAGLTAFGIAGADAAKEVYNQFLALHTVSDATGKTIAPMTGSLEKLHNAVRPQVFQLLGDAIQAASTKTGLFNKLALATGSVLDKLVAHLTVIITSAGPGLNTFLAAGAKDAAQLGRFLANIGDAILNLIKVTQETHIADFLLQGLVAASKLLDWITKLPTPLLAVVVGLHGLYLWGGLAATGLLRLVNPLVKIATTAGGVHAADQAVKGLAENAGPLTRLKAAFTDIGTGLSNLPGRISNLGKTAEQAGTKVGLLARAGNLVTKIPWQAGLAVGIIALGALAYAAFTAKTAAQSFTDALVSGISKVSNANLLPTINKDLETLNSKTAQVATTYKGFNGEFARTGASYHQNQQALAAYQGGQQQVLDQQKTVKSNLSYLEKQYGITQPQAITLATAAGVKLSGNITDQSMAAKTARVQIQGLVDGYGAMSAKGGQLGNDMEVLKRTATDQYQAIAKLNTGWDSFVSDLTNTQSGFDNVALGFNTLKDSATSAGNTLGKAHDKIAGLGTAIDGLTPKDLALNSAFTAQVGNLNTLFDSFRTAGLQNDLFTRGVKDGIAPMVKYAKGSKEATAQLIGLAQEAGFNGPVSMKALTKWLGNTHDATQSLKDITNQATIQEALLTGSMQDQGKFISQQLIGDINNAILSYDGVRQAAKKYGEAIAEDGRQSAAARKDRQNLIQDIIDAGLASKDSKDQIAAMISKVLGIPKRAAMQLVMTGTGSFTVKDLGGGRSITSTGTVRGVGGHTGAPGAAAGMMVSGGTAGRDSVLVNAMPGEVIVPTSMVKGGAVDHLRGKIPGFAGGGLVQNGDTSVLSGQFAVNKYDAFRKTFIDANVQALASTLKAAEKEASVLTGGISGNVRSYAPIVLAVLRMLGQPAGDLGIVLSQMTTESGGNPKIVNLSDSNAAAGTPSVGLMQVIGPTFAAYAGPFRNVGPFEYGTSVNPEANIYAALNYATHRYGAGWTSVLGHGHGYAGGTTGAAPGWAMVGEQGPELVNFSGGETVLPNHMSKAMGGMVEGYASGTKGHKHHHHRKPLDDRLENALHYAHSNRNEPVRYTKIEEHLEAVKQYMHNQSILVRFGHLSGNALKTARAGLRHDEADYKRVLKEIHPYSRTRHWMRGLVNSLNTQEKDLGKAIYVANNQGHHGLAKKLTGKLHWYNKTEKELGTWLDRILPVGTKKLGKKDNSFIESIINDAIRDAGLPIIPYDKGGWLPTGLSLAYNGLGRPEKVGGPAQPIVIQLSNSTSAFDMFMTKWLQHAVQVKGGGDVQVAFGRVN